MKNAFTSNASLTRLTLPRRWPDAAKGMETRDPASVTFELSDLDAVAIAAPQPETLGYAPVYIVAEGQEAFMTFMDASELAQFRKDIASRNLTVFGADNAVQPADLRFFDGAAQDFMIDPARLHRIIDGPEQINDYQIFRLVFDNNTSLAVTKREGDFDQDAALAANPVPVRPNETPRQKWFREADEGTVISNASQGRMKDQRRVLEAFAADVAAQAPQLYRLEGTKFPFYTRTGDIADTLIYTRQTDGARITFKKSEGDMYGMPVMQTAYFKSPEDAISGIAKLRAKMDPAKPQAAAPAP